ncbi:hypothetical protein GTC6_00755 [Gordonia terrae C-6]|uniref:Uncharacterized protein n=1 Tax=Gordonia terrae C-6 TaxID=1316928 RepID=R7YFE6_9ACTN|nr:hypothetical protein GTC6_00755 [Gordonia terrae C-6]
MTPYISVAAIAFALIAVNYLWVIGILLNIVFVFVGIALMANRGVARQVGTGITVAYLTFVAALGILIFVDYLKTDDDPSTTSSLSAPPNSKTSH